MSCASCTKFPAVTYRAQAKFPAVSYRPNKIAEYPHIQYEPAVKKSKQFINVGDRVRYIGKLRYRRGDWPSGAWLEKGIEGTVDKFTPELPAIPHLDIGKLEAWAVVQWDNGGSTAIDAIDEGREWERIGKEIPRPFIKYEPAVDKESWQMLEAYHTVLRAKRGAIPQKAINDAVIPQDKLFRLYISQAQGNTDVLLLNEIETFLREKMRYIKDNTQKALFGKKEMPRSWFDSIRAPQGNIAQYTEQYETLADRWVKVVYAKDTSEKMIALDNFIGTVHGYGSMANWFVEGGPETLDIIRESPDLSKYAPQITKEALEERLATLQAERDKLEMLDDLTDAQEERLGDLSDEIAELEFRAKLGEGTYAELVSLKAQKAKIKPKLETYKVNSIYGELTLTREIPNKGLEAIDTRLKEILDKAQGKTPDIKYEPFTKAYPTPEERLRTVPATSALVEIPPVSMDMEEFRAKWEPLGYNLLIIGPTTTWRTEWDEWAAIRDIVQNNLDETEGYFFYKDAEGFNLYDRGKGVGIKDFLLGPPKLKPLYARGRFGEGMKISVLTLLRLGYKVHVKTVGKEIWIIFFKSKIGIGESVEQLTALWRPDGVKGKGTYFHILGYTGPDYADRFAVNLPRRAILHRSPSPITEPSQRYNELISEPKGRIYARDIFMAEIESQWSYNLWGFEMAPDRYGPKYESDMYNDMGRLWATCTKVPLLERLLEELKASPTNLSVENRHLTFSFMGSLPGEIHLGDPKTYLDVMKENSAIWQKAWNNKFGSSAVLLSDKRWSGMVEHLGYTTVLLTDSARYSLAGIVRADSKLVHESQERLSEAEIIPDEKLHEQALLHLKMVREIDREYLGSSVKEIHAAIIPPASDRVRTSGMYSKEFKVIYISLDRLETAKTAVDTFIHELTHNVTGADDETGAFTEGLTRVAAQVIEIVSSGKIDSYMDKILW